MTERQFAVDFCHLTGKQSLGCRLPVDPLVNKRDCRERDPDLCKLLKWLKLGNMQLGLALCRKLILNLFWCSCFLFLQYVQAKRGMCVESIDSGYKTYEEPETFIWPDETSVLCIQ